MIPELEILTPGSVKEVVELLSKKNPGTRILAGGTDIIPGFQIDSKRFRDIDCLIDLAGVDEMKSISESADEVTIGAACTFTEISKNKIVKDNLSLLLEAANSIGSPQIRNRATIAGNFINNAPCADSVPPLLVYDAILEIKETEGLVDIEVMQDDFYTRYEVVPDKEKIIAEHFINWAGEEE